MEPEISSLCSPQPAIHPHPHLDNRVPVFPSNLFIMQFFHSLVTSPSQAEIPNSEHPPPHSVFP